MMRGLARIGVLIGVLIVNVTAAIAVTPDEMLRDPALEKRAREISAELRCLVCQNQSIDGSDAPLAADLRRLVRERLEAKDSNQQVLDYIVARYGEFVLLKPPFKPSTLILWFSPVAVLLGGILLARRASRQAVPAEGEGNSDLTVGERKELEALLKDGDA